MRLSDLVQSIVDLPHDSADPPISGLAVDSRRVRPGDLFVALAGVAADGARFAADAVSRGAAAVVAAPDADIAGTGAVPVLRAANPRAALALMAARFHGRQPRTVVAVTGTNGKTSVVSFVRQIWTALGRRAASIGTVGLIAAGMDETLGHTTPDPVELHRLLKRLADAGIDHLAVEASSHGLDQHRLDGVELAAGAFTNISRDHLDYHPTFQSYLDSKLRLFGELLPRGAAAVVNADTGHADAVIAAARGRGLEVLTVGRNGRDLRLVSQRRDGLGQVLELSFDDRSEQVRLPLVGDFQAANALVAAGLAMATGCDPADAVPAFAGLEGARGRLDLVATHNGGHIFVDYAHTPDALANALEALRPYTTNRLIVVFGCGGDRDRGKRPQMGAIAQAGADVVYVTDDNPRSEDPAVIRREIMTACPDAIEVADRREAIVRATADLSRGDVLLVAGKGHETGQIVGGEVLPFSDHEAVAEAIGAERADA